MSTVKTPFTPIRHGDWRKRNGRFVDVSKEPAAPAQAIEVEDQDDDAPVAVSFGADGVLRLADSDPTARRRRTRNSKRK